MKKLLLALTVLMLFMLVGCSYYEQGEEITPIDGFDVCYYNDSIWSYASDITCFVGEVSVNYSYELYIMRLADTTTTETPTTTTEPELQRYRVQIVEVIVDTDDDFVFYTVSKIGYTIGGIYALETVQTFQLNDILYVVIIDDYTAVPFAEWYVDYEGGN